MNHYRKMGCSPGQTNAHEQNHPGIKNISLSCYMNSILQCLGNCTDFVSEFLKYEPKCLPKIHEEFWKFLNNLKSSKSSISANDFASIVHDKLPSISPYEQNDPSFFYSNLINCLSYESKDPRENIFTNNFKLRIRFVYTCSCSIPSTGYDELFFITIASGSSTSEGLQKYMTNSGFPKIPCYED